MNKKTVYVIVGPTAVGKTAAAIELAQRLGTEIVSADSRQCYHEMSIGVARPNAEELAAVKHWFIDEFPVTEHITAADYERLALAYLGQIFEQRDAAVVVGGTGLYIKALCEGLDAMPDLLPEAEAAVAQGYEAGGIAWLQAVMAAEDPAFYAQGEIHNPHRMLRALAFVRSTGKSILEYRTNSRKKRNFDIVRMGIELPREVLYDRINRRVDIMVAEGLFDEARGLYPLKHLKNLQTVGYQEVFDYIDGLYTREEAIDKIKQHTRNYAKRQMTWFKKDKEVQWSRKS